MECRLNFADKSADWLSIARIGPFGALTVLLALYCVVQVVMMPLLSAWMGTGVGVDDAEQLMYMRFLWAGYGGSQPPLFTWLLWLVSSIFGTSVLTLKIVKYTLYLTTLLAIFAAVLRSGYSRRAATAAMLGLFLFPQFLWEMQHSLSHSVAAVCFSAVLLLAYFELLRSRSNLAYIAFGLAMGLAILGKYNNFILIAALFTAALSLREARRIVLTSRMTISLAVALLVCLPTLYWNVAHPGEFLARSYKFGLASNGLTTRLAGIARFLDAALNFAGVPILVSALAFLLARSVPRSDRLPPAIWEKLTVRTIAIGFGIIAILMIASGATKFRDRWFLPVLLFLPVAVAMYADRLGERGIVAQKVLICTGAVLALLALPFTWYYQVYGGTSGGSIARIDYSQLYKDMTVNGPVNTVISDWHWVGNLRLVEPQLVVLSPEVPDFLHQLREPVMLILLDTGTPRPGMLEVAAKAGYMPADYGQAFEIKQIFGGDGEPRQVFTMRLKKIASKPQ
jgi:hypothetical protein